MAMPQRATPMDALDLLGALEDCVGYESRAIHKYHFHFAKLVVQVGAAGCSFVYSFASSHTTTCVAPPPPPPYSPPCYCKFLGQIKDP
jgi:hypothetical protein